MDGWGKVDPASKKMLPVEVDVPELIVTEARHFLAPEKDRAVGDWALIAFYYLLWIGEYTTKASRNHSKQTRQFKMEDVTFFIRREDGRIGKLPWNTSDKDIMMTCSATLKLDNQKNGYKNVCVYHEANGETSNCPTKAIGRRYIHIRNNSSDQKTWLSAYWIDDQRQDVTNEDISVAVKWAAAKLDYPTSLGILVERIDTHSLCGGGACVLALAGYSDT